MEVSGSQLVDVTELQNPISTTSCLVSDFTETTSSGISSWLSDLRKTVSSQTGSALHDSEGGLEIDMVILGLWLSIRMYFSWIKHVSGSSLLALVGFYK